MRKTLFLLVLFTCTVKSQNLEENSKFKNTISLEFYQPFQNNIREFYNDDWILGYEPSEKSNYSRNAFSNAFGISYERVLKILYLELVLGFLLGKLKKVMDMNILVKNKTLLLSYQKNILINKFILIV